MSPARSWNVVGSHDCHPEKNWGVGPSERQDRWIRFAQSHTPPPLPECDTPITRRLYIRLVLSSSSSVYSPFSDRVGLLTHNIPFPGC